MPILANVQGNRYTVVSPEAGIISLKRPYLIARQDIIDAVEGLPPTEADRILDQPATDGDFRAAWVEAQHREVVNLTDDVSEVAAELDSKTIANQERIEQLENDLSDTLAQATLDRRSAESNEIIRMIDSERERLLTVLTEAEGGDRSDYIALVEQHLRNSNLSARLEELRGAL